MRKVVLFVCLVVLLSILTSCEDNSKQLQELKNEERRIQDAQIYDVDREDIERPGEQGGN